MCGIAGIWSNFDLVTQEKMVDIILKNQKHRGPDHTGKLTVDGITFGHNRLAIIDLSKRANQPLVSNCGRYVIVFNGEIFNYIELREELSDYYDFKTNSDTEVLLACFIKYGVDCLSKLNGMFAFAIYDKLEKILFCARDRIGEKPFVYSEHPTGFYFASELGALYSTGVFSNEPDEIGIAYSYLRNFRHIPEPFTRYKEIRRLEPAHAIIVKNKKIVRKWCYWKPVLEYDSTITEDDILSLLDDAVRLRERADVDVAVLMSGGVDSSAVASLMVQHGLRPKAFTLKADDEELNRAIKVADLLNIPIEVYKYDKGLEKKLKEEMFRIYGEEVRSPISHLAALCNLISKKGIKVVLSGIGGDELFYGYSGAGRQLLFSFIIRLLEILPQKVLVSFEKIFSSNRNLKLIFELAQIENYKRKGYLYRKEAISKGLLNFDYGYLLDYWAQLVKESKFYIDISHWLGLITENAHSITIAADLPGMMFGVEIRSPFLDHRLVELAFKINACKKVSIIRGHTHNKLILKRALREILPMDILYAKKKGLGYGLHANQHYKPNHS